MRLPQVESGHDASAKAVLAEIQAAAGQVDPIDRTLLYRPELFGAQQITATEAIVRGPSSWTIGERELMAAFVSAQNQCPF